MAINIRLGDITKLKVDAIVNAANESLLGGGGVDGCIHEAAGPKLLEECKKLGGCETGKAKMTKGYNLPAKHIIHTVGPVYNIRKREDCRAALINCYINSLKLAKENKLHSIAFPSISTGMYHYPKYEAACIALSTVKTWLRHNNKYSMDVTFCCFDELSYNLYTNLAKEYDII